MSDDGFSDDDGHMGADMDPEIDPNQPVLNVDVGSSLTVRGGKAISPVALPPHGKIK
jgi:hypothetical protein